LGFIDIIPQFSGFVKGFWGNFDEQDTNIRISSKSVTIIIQMRSIRKQEALGEDLSKIAQNRKLGIICKMPRKKKGLVDMEVEPEADTMTAESATAEAWMQDVPAGHKAGFVAVIGKPNVGKSTLVNLLVGHKVSIVSPRTQTTRRRIMGIMTLPEAQAVFVDTPGIHKPKHRLGTQMVEQASGALLDADLVLFVCDVSQPPDGVDRHIAELIRKEVKAPVLLILNKMDMLKPEKVVPNSEAYLALLPHAGWMMVAADKGHNWQKLQDLILQHLPENPPFFPPDQITDQTERLYTAEIIREKVLLGTYAEVPHGIGVSIDQWEERPNGVLYIAATIFVERDTHKSIVIGEKGQKLKRIGQDARKELERWLQHKLYLELWVKVREKWRDNLSLIRELELG
jgi:GTP-binding protein Era